MPARRPAPASPQGAALAALHRAALAALYRDADALHAGWSCPASTECCRFGLTGREPYVTALEVEVLRAALARRGGALSPRRRALPLTGPDEGACQLLDRDGRCAVYADRPLGCRTYFCERAERAGAAPRAALAALVRRLRDLAERHAPGEAPRPLTRVRL